MKNKIMLGGFVVGAMLAATIAPDAHADGIDPDWLKNSTRICGVLDNATTVKPVQDMFREYGRQYVADIVNGACGRNNMKVYVALMNFHMEEDDPGWDCAIDGNRICGPED